MKKILLLVASISCLALADNQSQDIIWQFSRIEGDLCWTTSVPGASCKVDGEKIKVIYPLDNFYVVGSYTQFESRDERTLEGDPYLSEDVTQLGIGKAYDLSETINAIVEASFLIAADDEPILDNTNYNDGFEIRGRLEKELYDKVVLGMSVAYQRFQNCSAENCHGLKDKKPVMENAEAELYGSIIVDERTRINYRISKIVDHYNKELWNGRDFGVNHALEIEYRFGK